MPGPYCISCNLTCPDMPSLARHFKTSEHQRAESKMVVGVPLDKFRGGSAKELNSKTICRVCRLAFPAKRVLLSHVKQSALHRERCGCKVCDKVFIDRQALKFHNKQSLKHRKLESARARAANVASASMRASQPAFQLGENIEEQLATADEDTDGADEDEDDEEAYGEDEVEDDQEVYGEDEVEDDQEAYGEDEVDDQEAYGEVDVGAEIEAEMGEDKQDTGDYDTEAAFNLLSTLSINDPDASGSSAVPPIMRTQVETRVASIQVGNNSTIRDASPPPSFPIPNQNSRQQSPTISVEEGVAQWQPLTIPVEGIAVSAIPSGGKVKPNRICKPCRLAFSNKGDKRLHVKHSPQHRELCECPICYKVFEDQSGRNSHMESCSRKAERASGSGRQTNFGGFEPRTRGGGHGRRRGGQRGGRGGQRGGRGGQRGGRGGNSGGRGSQSGGRGGGYRGRSRQGSRRPYCGMCDRQMDSEEGFQAHYKSQVHIDACVAYGLYCHACETFFGNEFGMQWHMLQHHRNNSSRRSR
ncbi:hypothetical protein BDD12DRAFT_983917 [Trichophaea hybrida]|nr:hypothetical protein BDD12DRAFT_983917 [Trichophaea hybrida]